MRLLTYLRHAFLGLFKPILSLPRTVSIALKERRQQIARDELEAERLDRIRNPSKYLGK